MSLQRWCKSKGVWCVTYMVLYVTLDWVSYSQPVLKLGITPWSPQTGLTLAFLLSMGIRWAPATATAAFAAELLVRGGPAHPGILVAASVWIAATYSLATVLLGNQAVPRALQTLNHAVRFVATAFVASIIAAAGYVGLFVLSGALPASVAVDSVIRYCTGDFNGMLMLTPLLLLSPRWQDALRAVARRLPEALVQFAIAAALVWLLFGVNSTDQLRFFYPLFVPVVWIAVRWGAVGALVASLLIQVGIMIVLRDAHAEAPLIDLQILMLTLGSTAFLLGVVVAERAAAVRRLAAREAELGAVLATAPDAIVTADTDGAVLTRNVAAVALFGSPAPHEKSSLNDLLPGLQPGLTAGRQTLQGINQSGSSFPADVAWVRLEAPAHPGWLVLVRDATDRVRSQNEAQEKDRALARAMRFAVAGELASALAHELNQPITALVSYLRASQIMAVAGGAQDGRLVGTLGKANDEAIRASQVLLRLRDFYQGAAHSAAWVDVAQCCRDVADLMQARLQRSGVRLQVELEQANLLGRAERTHVEMVVHNLITNAVDAVSALPADHRHVVVEARRRNNRISIRVHDSGCDVDAEVLTQLFEPFNTSKSDGMGLGLAISRNLVRAYEGDIVHSHSDLLGGACFEVTLHAAAESVAAGAEAAA